MQKITPFLWFDSQAEEAMNFYTSIFKDSKIGSVSRYSPEGKGQSDTVMTASFTINGMEFIALNGGPQFRFNESISFVINCSNQEEVDYYWERLTSEGGQESMCGWLKDKFGVSWQVVPIQLSKLMSDPDKAKAGRVMQALLKMRKISISELEQA